MTYLTPEKIEAWATGYETPLPKMGPKARVEFTNHLPRAAFIRSAAKGKPERHGLTDEHLAAWVKDLDDLADWHHSKTRDGMSRECDEMVAFLKAAVEKL